MIRRRQSQQYHCSVCAGLSCVVITDAEPARLAPLTPPAPIGLRGVWVVAALCANQLRRAGTQVIFIQLDKDDDPAVARKLQYLATVSNGAYFRFNSRTQEQQFSQMWQAVSAYVAGGEEAVKATCGQAATLLLQHLKQVPMPIIEERDRIREVKRRQG